MLPEMMVHTGPAKCFDSEEACCEGLYAGKVVSGDVVVVRYEGPKGWPRHAGDADSYRCYCRNGTGFHLRADYRWPFFRCQPGASIGHISPEAAAGGLLAYVEDGDLISIDIPNHKLELLVSEDEIAARRAKRVPPAAQKSKRIPETVPCNGLLRQSGEQFWKPTSSYKMGSGNPK